MAALWKERILHFLQPFKTEMPDSTPKRQGMGGGRASEKGRVILMLT